MRLAIVTTHPIQYQCPLWRELAGRPLLEVRVFFGSDFSVRGYRDNEFGVDVQWDVPLLAGYEHVFLENSARATHNESFFAISAKGLKRQLAEFKPDVGLVCGYMRSFWWSALRAVRASGGKVLVRSEATDEAFTRGLLKALIRRLLLEQFYARCNSFLAISAASREHYARMGVPEGNVRWCPYNVDSDLLARHRPRWSAARTALREEIGMADVRTLFVVSGKLVPRKDPELVLKAMSRMAEVDRAQCGLIFVGDGALRLNLEAVARKSNLIVHFAGFVNQSEIGGYYCAADCLIMPSRAREPWGLVVNEALHLGLPTIVSDAVGCARDLVVGRGTGFSFPAGDEMALAEALTAFHRLPDDARRAMQCIGEKLIGNYTTQRAADAIEQAARRLT